MPTDTVRVCLNTNNYQGPSGGYKAHSKNTGLANAHKCGIGLEEWLNSSINIVSGQILIGLGFEQIDPASKYRIAHIEAYRLDNYRNVGDRARQRDVDLVTNPQRGKWAKIAEITGLRALSKAESDAIFSHFRATGVLAQMDSAITAALAGQAILFPEPPPNISHGQLAEHTFTCIFKTENLRFIDPPVPSTIIRKRYTRHK